MPRLGKGEFEAFGDGILSVCETDERCLTSVKASRVRFGNRTVGIRRYWEAKTAGDEISLVVSIPLEILRVVSIFTGDIVLLDTHQYRIVQVQPKYDTRPPSVYLSLENLVHPFKEGRNEDGG